MRKISVSYFMRIALFLVCAAGVIGFMQGDAFAATAKPREMIISHCDRDVSNIHMGYVAAKKFLEETGKFKVTLYPNSALSASEADAIQQTIDNEIQVTQAPVYVVGNMSGVTGFEVYNYPFFIETAENYAKVAASDMAADLAEQVLKKLDVRLGRGWYNGPMTVASAKRPIKVPQDLKGFKMRSTTSPITIEWLTQLGANPVPMLTAEVYTALQQGTIDGTYSAPHVHTEFKYDEVCNYFYKDGSSGPVLIPMISNKFYQTCSPEEKKLLDEALLLMSETARKEVARMDAEAQEYMIKNFGFAEPSEADKVYLRDVGKKVLANKASVAGQKYIDWTKKILDAK